MSWLEIASLVAESVLKKPATRLYPLERREPYPRTRGHIQLRVTDCNYCTICAHRCPTRAIVVDKTAKTWAIDHTACILCGNCVDDCKESCIELSNRPLAPMAARDVAALRETHSAPPPLRGEDGMPVEPPVPSADRTPRPATTAGAA